MKPSNKDERRSFLKQASVGSVGLGAAISSLAASDPVFARLQTKYTYEHVADLMEKVRSAEPSSKAQLAFEQTINNIKQLIIEKDEIIDTVSTDIRGFLEDINVDEFGKDNKGMLGLPQKLTDTLVGAYLAGINRFEFGEFEASELHRSLELRKPLEPDFLSTFAENIQQEIHLNSKVNEQFVKIGRPAIEKILSDAPGSNSKNKLVDPVTLTWVIIIVVVVVIAVFAAIFGEKR